MYFGNSLHRPKPILEQIQAIRTRWPEFQVKAHGNGLLAIGNLRPTARSILYKVEVKYEFCRRPEVILLDPKLMPNFNNEMPEHLYPREVLCLYRPIYGEFRFSDLVSETILPWTALWLYHYESWHNTGEWLGGGEHPTLL